MRNRWGLGCVLIVCICLCGCAGFRGSPELPPVIDPQDASAIYTLDQFNRDKEAYDKAVASGDLVKAALQRDEIVYRVMVDIERSYRSYEQSLYGDRALGDFGLDAMELSLAGATALSGGEAAKTVISTIHTAVKGGRLSFDKNFFRERTTEILIAQMRASRDQVRNLMREKLEKHVSVENYSLNQAWSDLIEFAYAGTIHSALVGLANSTGAKAEAARLDGEKLSRLAIPTDAQYKTSIDIRQEFNKLYKAGDAASLERAMAILKKMNIEPKADATREEVFVQLNAEIRKAGDDPSHWAKLKTAFAPE